MMLSKQENKLFNSISRSHLYWGRKPTSGLAGVLEALKPGDIFLDPFCGGGTPIISALNQGARVIASDLNPMAVFLSKVLIQPISVFALKETFESIQDDVADSILENYTISCPKCGRQISFDYLKWSSQNGEEIPQAVKVKCNYCGLNELTPLKENEIKRQKDLSRIRPKFWFPSNSIRTQRKIRVEFFHELFTGRNLTSLAQLYNAIDNISSVRCKKALQYVFTAMLYSCSSLQMFSKESPSSSRGWAARRFYLPPLRKEKNVWQSFEARFKNMLRCKKETNLRLPFVRLSNSMEGFENSDDAAYIYEADFLKFPFPKQLHISHVFLDPPYIHDIDYLGFSEFWGSWLGMDFDTQSGWHPGTISIEENTENLYRILMRIRENTTPSCVIILAYDLKNASAWKLIQEKISKAGYSLQPKSPIFLDNPQRKIKKNRDKAFSTDQYFLLQRKTKRPILSPAEFSGSDLTELQFFLRVTSFLFPEIDSIDTIIERASNLLTSQLQTLLFKQKKPDVAKWISDYELNRKAYNRYAIILIKLILAQDDFKVVTADVSQFDESHLNGYDEIKGLTMPQGLGKGAGFVGENDQGKKIIFCFYDESNVNALKRISNRVVSEDGDKFHRICYLIVRNHDEMMKCRKVRWADNWPRGFFIKFNKILEKAKEIDKARFGHMAMMSPKTDSNFRTDRKIEHFKARVIKNIPVGGNGNPKHFTIRFQAPELKYVVPGQFVMIDTLPYDKRKDIDMRRPVHSLATLKSRLSHDNIIDLSPKSFLKRPFSIHRTFYRNFKWNYLKNMSLPPALALITHTVFPNEFEIFYKLVESGTGTNELKEIKKGNTFQVLGPLGKITTVSDWRSEGIEEVHLIGGGVGMAPLMFFGQALRYYSFMIKAFIGIDRLDTLLYKAPFGKTFEDDPSKAYVYVDNLRSIGLHDKDIYISFEKKDETNGIDLVLPKTNYSQGFVSQQYASYLNKLDETDNILVLTCGPKPMLKALEKITSESNIRMKVLLEKRMGCGIGVCMSCVCRTKKNNGEQYSRVCMEGPLFDSKDIVWDKL